MPASSFLEATGSAQRLRKALVLIALGVAASLSAAQTTPRLSLQGTGVAGYLIKGCSAGPQGDWIDATPWVERRVTPAHCSIARDNPPVVSWRQSAARSSDYTLTLERREAGAWRGELSTLSGSPRFLPLTSLPTGKYRWRVSYVDRMSGATVNSAWRRFDLPAGAAVHTVLTGQAVQATAASRAHPRVLPDGVSWASVRSTADQEPGLKAILDRLIGDARWYADTWAPRSPGPQFPLEPVFKTLADFGGNATLYNSHLNQVATTAFVAAHRIVTLAYSIHLETVPAYRDLQVSKMRDWMMQLASWTTSGNGATSHSNQDQANRRIYLGLAQAYDLAFDHLSSFERQQLLTAIHARLELPLAQLLNERVLDQVPYNSHAANSLYYLIRALLLATETGGAEEVIPTHVLADAWNIFQAFAHVWGDTEGADGNGTDYGWTNFEVIPETLYLTKTIVGADLSRRAYFRNAIYGLIAQSPPNSSGPGAFGDTNQAAPFAAFGVEPVALYARVTGNAHAHWYTQLAPPRTSDLDLVSRANLLAAASRPANPSPLVPPNDYVFADVGLVAFHTDVADPQRSSLLMRSSRFGAWSHSHGDQNAIVFASGGVPLLVNGGVFDYWGSPHHKQVHRATHYKNAVTFDGGQGQAQNPDPSEPVLQTMDAHGGLLNAATLDAGISGALGIATGDAARAYRRWRQDLRSWESLVQSALRTVIYHRGQGIVVLYDFMESSTARTWEINFNSFSPFLPLGAEWQLADGIGSACLSVLGPATSFTSSNSYPVAPLQSGTRPQWNARFAVTTPTTVLRSVTVIRDKCMGAAPSVTFSTADSAGVELFFADGMRVTLSRASVVVY